LTTPAEDGAPRPPGRRGRLRAALSVAGVTILALLLLTKTELFGEFEAAARDAQARLLSPRESDRIVVVEIDETDYDSLFGARSPLAPDVVQAIIDAVLASGPRAIGVDLETSHESYEAMVLPSDGPPIVWAREVEPCELLETSSHDSASCHHGMLAPRPFLGGHEEGHRFGLATLPFDHGGTIRRYQRVVETTGGPMPTFAWALREVSGGEPAGAADTGLRGITFRPGEPLRVPARTVLSWAADSIAGATSGILHDRIVLVGGTYRAARDEYHTPLGAMPGVDILAQVLETELEGGGTPTPSTLRLLLVQSLFVIVLVALFVRLRFTMAFLLTLLVMPAMALVGGWLTTGVALTGFAYFLPLLVVMLIHILYEKVIEYREALMAELVRRPGHGGHAHGIPLDRLELGFDRLFSRQATRRAPAPKAAPTVATVPAAPDPKRPDPES
jgi:CHASE2 domain-containing sensor protein